MRVILKQTGQLGDIPDDKFDPSLFSMPSQATQPSQQASQSMSQDQGAEQSNQGPGNSLLDFLLPTAGGIIGGIGGAAIPVLGETGVGEIGGAALGSSAGQALADILNGRQIGADVPITGAISAATGGIGALGGKLLGKALTGVGEDIATGGLNLTKSQLARFAATHGEDVSSLLGRNKLTGASLDSLEGGIDNLQGVYNGIAKNSDITIDPKNIYTNIGNTISKLRNSPVQSDKALSDTVEQNFNNITQQLGDNPTLSDINTLKQSFDKATSDSQFGSSQWGANRIVGDTLRKTLNQSADAAGLTASDGRPLSQIGTDLMKLRNLSETAANRVGVGAKFDPFSLTNLVLGEGGMLGAGAIGANPLAGLLLPAARVGVNALKTNPAIASGLSNTATGVGSALTKAIPFLGGAGAVAGAGLASTIGEKESQTGNNNNQPSEPHAGNIPQQDENGNYQLPALGNAANKIPTSYSLANMQADIQKAGRLPFYERSAAMEQIKSAYSASQQQAQEYASKFALPAQEEDFMFNANNTNSQMNELRNLIQKEGTGWENMTPGLIALKSYTDPQFGRMISLMTTLRSAAEYNQAHGRLSNFDIQYLNNMPTVTDSKATALAKLDANQKYLAQKYTQNLPFYGLNTYLNSGVNQIQQMNQSGTTQNPVNMLPPQLQQQILGIPQGQ